MARRETMISLPVADMNTFASRLARDGQVLRRSAIQVLQINVGKLCNQACSHCHVDAGPNRREIMPRATMDRILDWLRPTPIGTIDITGGAPEMNPEFEYLVTQCRRLGRHVIDRCNLTILLEPGKEHLAGFLKEHCVELACSLPCYLEENVDRQRGGGVFQKSIAALRLLNDVGYGVAGSGLILDLVYNPLGATLPPPQDELERAYKRELSARYSISFNRLWTVTNMPISRFAHFLERAGQTEAYQTRLERAHNPENVARVMCRTMLSVDWRGILYDCDFNQMLDWPLGGETGIRLWGIDFHLLAEIPIRTGRHCFGCTAGCGSSCGGALL